MKNLLRIIDKFLSKKLPWWVSCILGFLLMIVPPCYAASKGITSLEPGFSYGSFYGIGLCLSLEGYFAFFEKKKSVDPEQ